jgi:ABC-2 type transport system permease protein
LNRITIRKWLEIVRFELVFQLRRKSTWFFFGLFLIPLIGVTLDRLTDVNRVVFFRTPLFLAEQSFIMGLVVSLILAGIAGDAATRDVQTRLEPLMQAAPITRAAYVGGRFIGAFVLAMILLAAIPLVHIVTPFIAPDAQAVGPFRAAVHLESYFLVLLPNAFVTTALMFSTAMLVRHAAGSYAVIVIMFAWLQLGVAVIAEQLGLWELASLLEPTGFAALELIGRTWSPVDLKERLIGSDPGFLVNRLAWIAIAGVVLALVTRRFDFGGNAGAVRWWQRGRLRVVAPGPRGGLAGSAVGHSVAVAVGLAGAAVGHSVPVAAPRAPREFGAAARVRQTLAIVRDSLREVMTVWTWLVVPILIFNITGTLNMLENMGAGTMVLPSSELVLAPIDEDAPPPLVLAVLMFPIILAGELIWRERDANMQALADAAPVPDSVRFVGKVLALWLVFVALYTLAMLAGLTAQVLRGWYDFDLPLYVQILGLRAAKALVFATFALSVHVLVNQKHVAHLLTMIAILGPLLIAEFLRIEHPLLLLGYEPVWRHSPISGFGPYLGPVLWFRLYWAAWVLLLALVARLFWVRGVDRGFIERVRLARHRLSGGMAGAVVGAGALVLLVGGFVFYNTNVLNAYQRSAEGPEQAADYERTYGRYRDAARPEMIASVLNVELYPDRREADIRGVHHLMNRTSQPIDTIHVAISSEVETEEIQFDRPAEVAVRDDELRHHIYVLDEPLQPGDSVRMSWQVRHAPRGFPARGISTAVVGNGSFFQLASWMPLIGYQRFRELNAPGDRREHGLPDRPSTRSLDDVAARSDSYGMDPAALDVTVGTSAGQIAVAPGELRRTWTQDGRSYFHYVTDAPVGIEHAIFSADYAVRRGRWRDVALEVYHHPEHTQNVDRIMRGMEASLEQLTERFGPYPYKVLRFIEYAGAGGSLHATLTSVWYLELFSLFDPDHEPRRIDLPFGVVGHEVAHQFQPVPASVEGRSLLSESFAWYAALGVIEQEYGPEHFQRFLGFMREAYLDPRSRADVPLLRASDFFLGYRKGPFAMYALQEYVGRDSVDLAWRRLRERHASGEPPFATSLDLYRELQAVTPDSLQGLLADLIERNTFWELQTTEATAQQTAGGEWQVTIDVTARKVVVDTAGVVTEMPMGDPIEIGLFAAAEESAEGEGVEVLGRPLYLAMHRIRTGPQTITITVAERPARVGIDPRHLLIDDYPGDNVLDVPDPSPPTP